MERAARDALVLELSPDRCRVLIAAVGQALRLLEIGSIEERIAALEARLDVPGSSTGMPQPSLTAS